jgi:hypothetical protein
MSVYGILVFPPYFSVLIQSLSSTSMLLLLVLLFLSPQAVLTLFPDADDITRTCNAPSPLALYLLSTGNVP